ncbi:MAG: transposase, partial [Halioglobus sp.]
MPNVPKQLPNDIDALKALVAEQDVRNTQLDQENARLGAKVLSLQEQLNLALARRYAASSEKLSPDQIRLFNEAEVEAQGEPVEDEAVTVPEHSRKKRGRKKLPDAIPRVDVVHELSAEDQVCPHDGASLTEIGEVVSEQMDETPVQVLKEPDKRAQSKSYLWLQRGGPPDQPVVLYDYDPGRGAGVPLRLLEGFRGYLQTDGYDGYNAAVASNGLVHMGCMAHARRKFSDAVKAQ